ncbi:MAG: (d)CMP kinase [Bacteroidetes bacterium]|nr:(d)CMP kinase [Bacteroidota bacterium]MBU1422998.1 (d)CMP kinase [Bacteroidota bacterium]
MLKKIVIAIDGPAASGKSTTAKLTAEKLNYLHIDTGAMYRALTLKVIENNVNPEDETSVYDTVKNCVIEFDRNKNAMLVFLDGKNVTEAIRNREVTRNVSAVSSYKKVRQLMVNEQRRLSEGGGVVLEGRDIGTVVVPNADLKIFMVASVEERVKRRQKELAEKGTNVDYDKLVKDIIDRDTKDSKRTESPLRKADDAIILDTSNLTINQQVDFIVDKALEIINSK